MSRLRERRAALVLTAVATAAAGCGDGTTRTGADALRDRTFLSTAVTTDGVPKALVTGTRIRLTFGPGDRVGASAGCNTMSGPATLTRDRIVVRDLATTDIGCTPALHDQDTWLAGLLTGGAGYALAGDDLRLTSGGTVVVLVDRTVADPDRPLSGTRWRLDGIVEGESVSSVPAGVVATLRIDGDRLAVAVEQCNQGGADVTVGPAEIRVGPLTMTEISCEAPAGVVEAAIVAVLRGTIRYEIEAASLTLTHPSGRGLLWRATG